MLQAVGVHGKHQHVAGNHGIRRIAVAFGFGQILTIARGITRARGDIQVGTIGGQFQIRRPGQRSHSGGIGAGLHLADRAIGIQAQLHHGTATAAEAEPALSIPCRHQCRQVGNRRFRGRSQPARLHQRRTARATPLPGIFGQAISFARENRQLIDQARLQGIGYAVVFNLDPPVHRQSGNDLGGRGLAQLAGFQIRCRHQKITAQGAVVAEIRIPGQDPWIDQGLVHEIAGGIGKDVSAQVEPDLTAGRDVHGLLVDAANARQRATRTRLTRQGVDPPLAAGHHVDLTFTRCHHEIRDLLQGSRSGQIITGDPGRCFTQQTVQMQLAGAGRGHVQAGLVGDIGQCHRLLTCDATIGIQINQGIQFKGRHITIDKAQQIHHASPGISHEQAIGIDPKRRRQQQGCGHTRFAIFDGRYPGQGTGGGIATQGRDRAVGTGGGKQHLPGGIEGQIGDIVQTIETIVLAQDRNLAQGTVAGIDGKACNGLAGGACRIQVLAIGRNHQGADATDAADALLAVLHH